MISIVLLIRRGSGHKVPYLTKKLLVMESCQEREKKISFLQWGDTEYISHTPEQASCSRTVFQYKMHFMFECDFFCYRLVGFCLLGILFVLFSCWNFFGGGKEKEHEDGLWKELIGFEDLVGVGGGEKMIKIYGMKFLKIKEIFLSYLFFYS